MAKPRRPKLDINQVLTMRREGISWAKISRATGYGVSTVIKRYKKYHAELEANLESNIPEEKAVEEAIKVVEKKVPPEVKKEQTSKPWKENPWTLDRLMLPKAHEGFHPVFLRKKDPDYIRMREEQGYQIANCRDYGLEPRQSKGDKFHDSSPDTSIQRGDLILAELPHHLWLKRQEYKRMKTAKQQSRSRDEVERAKVELARDGLDMKVTQEKEHTSFKTPETFTTTSTKDI